MSGVSAIVVAVIVMISLNILLILMTIGVRALTAYQRSRRERVVASLEPLVVEYLTTGQVPARLETLSGYEQDVLAEVVVEMLSQVRGASRAALLQLSERVGLVDRYRRMLQSPRKWRRALGAERLGHLGGRAMVGPLSRLMHDRDETVRAVAARGLAHIGGEEAVALLARSLDDPSELTSLRVAENLQRLGQLAVPALVEALGRGDGRGVVLAARILGNLRAYPAREAFARAVTAGSTDVRAQSVLALGKVGDPDDVPLLLRAARDPEWPVRAQVANALGMIGDVSALGTLVEMCSDREWWVRHNATRALARMGPAGRDALLDVIRGQDRYAREQAVAALEAAGFVDEMIAALDDPGPRGDRAREDLLTLIRSGSANYAHSFAGSVASPNEPHSLLEEVISSDLA